VCLFSAVDAAGEDEQNEERREFSGNPFFEVSINK
jgi:hypothetical protein